MTECRLIELPKITDPRGNLTFIEGLNHIPFEIRRVFYLYDVPGGSVRDGHAMKTTHEFIIAMSGSFDIHIDDGSEQACHHMNRSYYGLYVPPGTWCELDNFSSGSVCLVFASEPYSREDYSADREICFAHHGEPKEP